MAWSRRRVADFDGALAEVAEDEVGRARDVGDAEFLQADAEQFARGQHFGDVVLDVGRVLHGGLRGQHRERIHAVGRLRFVQVLRCWPGARRGSPGACAAMPKTLENVRQTKRLGYALDLGQRGDAAEFVVGFVDQDGGLRRALRMRSMASRPRPVPVGLLGLAIRRRGCRA